MEQYFFIKNIFKNLVDALEFEDKILCLSTPVVAESFYKLKNTVIFCLDIYDRFNYLPDILNMIY